MLVTPTTLASNSKQVNHALMDLLRTQGSTVTARVLAVVELNEANIREMLAELPKNSPLLKLLHEQLQRTKNTQTSTNADTSRALEANNGLQLAKLGLKVGGRSITNWTISEQKLQTGNVLSLSNNKGELIFNIKGTTPNNSPADNQLKQPVNAKLKTNTFFSKNLINSNESSSPNGTKSAQTIAVSDSALRKYLPKQDTQLHFFRNITKSSASLSNELVELANRHSHPASKSIASSLQTLHNWSKTLPTINALSAETVSQAIKNSGIFLEQQLKQVLSSAASEQKTPINLSEADSKSPLLATLLTTSLITSNQTSNSKDAMFDSLIKAFLSQSGVSQNVDAKQGHSSQALKLLESLATASLARVTSNQLQTLSTSSHEGNWQSHLQTDIFIQLNHTLLPIAVQLYERGPETKQKATQRSRDWRIFMEWEFPEHGAFSSEIKYVNERLSTKLWAEKPEIQQGFKDNIHTLFERFEKEGIAVDNIHCATRPLKENSQKHKTLVDVRT